MIGHKEDTGNPVNEQRYYILHNWRGRQPYDGLAQVKYKILKTENYSAYEKITIDIGFYGDEMTFYHKPVDNILCKNHLFC